MPPGFQSTQNTGASNVFQILGTRPQTPRARVGFTIIGRVARDNPVGSSTRTISIRGRRIFQWYVFLFSHVGLVVKQGTLRTAYAVTTQQSRDKHGSQNQSEWSRRADYGSSFKLQGLSCTCRRNLSPRSRVRSDPGRTYSRTLRASRGVRSSPR